MKFFGLALHRPANLPEHLYNLFSGYAAHCKILPVIKRGTQMRIIRTGLVILLFSVVAGSDAGAYRERYSPEPVMNGVQDAIYLEQRIRSVEQRLFSIQSSISRLEQQVNISQRSAPTQGGRSPEIELLRSEVEILRARVRELECGLAHLDERTLTEAAKVGRKRTGAQAIDPCRVHPETPIQSSRRP